jgi:hypothetical protein
VAIPQLSHRDFDVQGDPAREGAAGHGVRARAALKPLLWRPLLFLLRASDRRAGLVLMYHDVGDRDGDSSRELVPPISRARLARQLAHLRRHYQLVELLDLQAAVAVRRRGERFLSR